MRALPPRQHYLRGLARSLAIGTAVIVLSLCIGVVGYHLAAGLSWLDATLNAAMILAGEGPVDPMRTTSAKVFASAYALFSGVVFISVAGILIAPAAHRFLHRFHLEVWEDPQHVQPARVPGTSEMSRKR
jgi:predicted branched-subunit amino acid permease